MTSTLYIYSFNIQQDAIKDSLNPSMEGTVIGWKKEIHVFSVPGASGMDRDAVHCVERVVSPDNNSCQLSDANHA